MSLVSVLGCGTWFFPIEEQLYCLERYRLPCRRGGSDQPQTVSARRVGGPHAGGDRALDADFGLPFQEGHAPRVAVFPRPAGVHHGGLQCVSPVAWLPALCVWLRAPLDGRV